MLRDVRRAAGGTAGGRLNRKKKGKDKLWIAWVCLGSGQHAGSRLLQHLWKGTKMQLVVAPPLPGHKLDAGVEAGGALDGIFPPFGGTAFLNFGGGVCYPVVDKAHRFRLIGPQNSMEVKKYRELQEGSDGD